MRIDEAISGATADLGPVSESPRLDAELLLARALDVQRSYLIAHPEHEMDLDAAGRFAGSVKQRLDGVPMAYITGAKEFWSMELLVSPATLVPRPETETLVDQALMRIPRRAELDILDLGTGSGAIALALARERPTCRLTATDVSADAIAVATENARQLMIPNIEFITGSWFEPVAGRTFDLIVSNPPYIASADTHLDKLRHEPRSALESGPDGLDAIRLIVAGAPLMLADGGRLLLEHGADQAAQVGEILAAGNWVEIGSANDLAGLPRVASAIRP